MSDPGLVIGHLTLKGIEGAPGAAALTAPDIKELITALNNAVDNDDVWVYNARDWEWKVVSYTTSLHASARAFRDIVTKHRKYIKEFSLAIHALEEPYEELYFTGGRFIVNKVQR